MNREQVERYYVEVTHPDELGITDPRMKAVFDLALKALTPAEADARSGRWVPVEPTKEMLRAALPALDEAENGAYTKGEAASLIYKAMLQAAPDAGGTTEEDG